MAKSDNYYGRVIMPKGAAAKRKKTREKIAVKNADIKKGAKPVLICAAAYLLGRVSLFNSLNPIGIAFLAACMGMGAMFYPVCLAVFLGYITGSRFFGVYGYAVSIALLAVSAFIFESKAARVTEFKKCVSGGICLFIGGIVVSAANDFSLFLALRAAVEAVAAAALTAVMCRSLQVFERDMSKRVLSDDEALCICVPAVFVIASLSGITFFGVSVKMLLCIFFMTAFSYSCGAAAGGAAGCVLGFVLIMCGQADYVFPIVMSFAGMMCGLFGRQSRTAALFAFALSASVPAFYMGMKQDMSGAVMSVLGACLFLTFPRKYYDILSTYSSGRSEFDENKYFIKVKKYTEEKINRLAEAFGALADIFGSEKTVDESITPRGSAKIIDMAAERVCQGCGLCIYCWKAKTLETYGAVYSMINDFEETGTVDIKKLPPKFGRSCVKVNQLSEAVLSCCREFKTSEIWKSRLEDSKSIIKEQLRQMTDIIKETGESVDLRPNFDESTAKEIKERIERKGFGAESVSVCTDKSGKMKAVVESGGCGDGNRCGGIFVPEISAAAGRRMVLAKKECGGEKCISTYEEETGFGCSFAYSCKICGEGEVSGDSFDAGSFRSGMFTAAVSDGMGTGEKAAKQSRQLLEKLKKLLKAGFDEETAVRAVNCSVAGEYDESFATLDILSVDLKSGKGRIIKNGGSSVFIIRNGSVTAVRSTSLPLGISCMGESEVTAVSLEDKDVVLMVTDGITDAFMGENEENAVKAVLDHSPDIKTLCSELIKYAVKKEGGKAKDDMLAAAVKIYEN